MVMDNGKSIEQMIYDETEKRLNIMQSPDYEFPKRISKADVIGIVSSVACSIVLIALCMAGVIK